jgi:Cu(I)/Ag(I) efflux system periplasmic protein CusF
MLLQDEVLIMKFNTNNLALPALLALTFFAANNAALAAEAGGMTNMPGMSMPAKNADTQSGHAVGVVTAINKAANTLTIATEAVPELKWPAMTMDYKVAGTAAANISSGQKVNFEFTGKGMDVTITKIAAVK